MRGFFYFLASFVISSKNGHICRLGIFKTVVRLGDSFRGYLDFQAATIPCHECVIQADTNEFFDPSPQQDICMKGDLPFSTLSVDLPIGANTKGILA